MSLAKELKTCKKNVTGGNLENKKAAGLKGYCNSSVPPPSTHLGH